MATEHSDDNGAGVDLRDAFYALGLITLVVAALYFAADILAPIVLALLLWFLINAIAEGLGSLPGIGRIVPFWLLLTLATVLTLGVMVLVGQVVASNIAQIDVQASLAALDSRLAQTAARIESTFGVSLGYDFAKLASLLQENREIITTAVKSATNAASTFALILLFVLFLLLDQPYYHAKIQALFPERARRDRVQKVLQKIGEDTRIYIWLMTTVSVVVGVATWLIADYFKVPGAAFWGFLAFALNYIPTIGSFLGVLFPALFAFVQFDEIEKTAIFIGLLSVVQFLAGNIVLPRMMGDRLNLSEFVVILSLSIWGVLWGVPGLFLGVPLMMVLAIVLSQFESTRAVAILMSKTGRVMSR